MNTFRIVTLRQPDGTYYGGLHAPGVCRGAYGFASRELAWSFAWDQQQRFVAELHAAEAEEMDDCPPDGVDFMDVRLGDPRLH